MPPLGSIFAKVIVAMVLLASAWMLYLLSTSSTYSLKSVSYLPQNLYPKMPDPKCNDSVKTILMWTDIFGKREIYGLYTNPDSKHTGSACIFKRSLCLRMVRQALFSSSGESAFVFPGAAFIVQASPRLLLIDKTDNDGVWSFDDLKIECDYKCELTHNRALLKRSHAVLFHAWGRDLHTKTIHVNGREVLIPSDPPPVRDYNQFYVYVTLEAPVKITTDMEAYRDFFNWTMAYRHDSDFPITYGQLIKKTPEDIKSFAPDSLQELAKTDLVAWLVSNCKTVTSGRDKLVRELKKYIPVNVYGKCGDKRCNKTIHPECYSELATTHKFYLAFENSLCKDYVTEKFFKALEAGMVPVVYGGTNYGLQFPYGSFIHIESFASAKALADYLLYLDSNSEEYLKYFQWKKYYRVSHANGAAQSYCNMCKRLHEECGTASSTVNVLDWSLRPNSSYTVCIPPPDPYW